MLGSSSSARTCTSIANAVHQRIRWLYYAGMKHRVGSNVTAVVLVPDIVPAPFQLPHRLTGFDPTGCGFFRPHEFGREALEWPIFFGYRLNGPKDVLSRHRHGGL
jgi:hypothetical protein